MKYTEDEKTFIFDNVCKLGLKKTAEELNHQFGSKRSIDSVKSFCSKHKINIRSSCGSRIREAKKHPIWEERVRKGYVYVKISDNGSRWENWQLKHKYLWEKEYGKVPKSHVVIFLDGNNRNFDINNLFCIERSILVQMNFWKLENHNPELIKAQIMAILLKQELINNGTIKRRYKCSIK